MSEHRKEEQPEEGARAKLEQRACEYAQGMMGIGEWSEKWEYGDKVMYNNLRRSFIQGGEFQSSKSEPAGEKMQDELWDDVEAELFRYSEVDDIALFSCDINKVMNNLKHKYIIQKREP